MSLVSNLFLLFVAASVLVYYIVPHKFQWLVLLCFSYIYYLAGGVRYVGFLLFSTLITWLIALAVEKTEAKGSHKGARNRLVLGLLLNFGMIGVVKYTTFAIENLTYRAGCPARLPARPERSRPRCARWAAPESRNSSCRRRQGSVKSS